MNSPAAALPICWSERASPLEPIALAALGSAGHSLAQRLLNTSPARPLTKENAANTPVQGLVLPAALVVCGATNELPWVQDGCYFGHTPEHPNLWVPTHQQPDLPIALVERALRQQVGLASGTIAVWPEYNLVIDLRATSHIEPGELRAFLAGSHA